MPDETIRLLCDLIAIDSVNPSLVPGATGELEITSFIAQVLKAGGLDVEVQEIGPGRRNFIGVPEGRQRGRPLILCGHMETVAVIGMDAAFDPVQRNGRIYGRGSQDMKGGLASMIAAALHISKNGGAKGG